MCPQNGIKHKVAITVRNQCYLLLIAALSLPRVLFRVVDILTNMAELALQHQRFIAVCLVHLGSNMGLLLIL